MPKRKMTKKAIFIWTLLLIGFAAMEFPGVLLFKNKVEPFIFGLPFIYGYIICLWLYMCAVLLYAYKTSWGQVKTEGNND